METEARPPLTTRLVIRKGQVWSVIEHLVLESLAQAPRSRLALAQRFNLKPQIIDAALIRLARVLWVEMRTEAQELLFVTTVLGRAALSQSELPSPGRIIPRQITLVIDRLAGHLFASSDFTHDQLEKVQKIPDYDRLCVLKPRLPDAIFRVDELVSRLHDDEQLLYIDPNEERRSDEVAVLRLKSGRVEGLPADRELPELVEAIRAGVQSAEIRDTGPMERANAFPPKAPMLQRHPISFDQEDLIVGGEAHRRALDEVFSKAVSRIILHSTFIGEEVFRRHLPAMRAAIERDVHIDIVWGQDPPTEPDKPSPRPTAAVISSLNADPQIAALNDSLRLHTASTRSHAKLIIADVGVGGEYIALVGSCNWLASGLSSVEVTVRMRTPAIVAQLVSALGNLLYVSDQVDSGLSLVLLRIARLLKRRAPPNIPTGTAQVVIGAQHAQYVLQARDQARGRIFVMSHRLSEISRPGILEPFASARAHRRLTVTALYGKRQDHVTVEVSQRIEQQARSDGITLKRIRDPRIHAKVLAWDSNSIVVTSQNSR